MVLVQIIHPSSTISNKDNCIVYVLIYKLNVINCTGFCFESVVFFHPLLLAHSTL